MNATNPAGLARRAGVMMALGGAALAQATNGVLLFETFDNGASGWTVEHIDGSGGWRGSGGNPGGAFILNEGGNPSTDPSIYRTVTGLRIGMLYRIEGDYREYYGYCAPNTPIAFRVDLNGLTVYSGARAVQWTHFEAEWVATSAQVTVLIRAETDGTDCDAVIDNIQFREVFPCPGDVTDNEIVDAVDLTAVLSAWGTSGQGQFDTDINNDGIVDGADLAFVLSGWGPCP